MSAIQPRVVVVPFDFSKLAAHAFPVAAAHASQGATIHVLHVLSELAAGEPGVAWGEIDDEQRMEHARESLRRTLASHGLQNAVLHVLAGGPGNPAWNVADLARKVNADLIVTTSHGRTGLLRFAMGSVSERIVRLAPCAVLVLRAEPE
jgi:nucleotide-binding universal stress UspA family protein